MEEKHFEINRASWNERAEIHYGSDFYNVIEFKKNKNSLNPIERELLGSVEGKNILHALCHFGQDSLSLAHPGAEVTAFDLSDKAIELAKELSTEIGLNARFINCNYYDRPIQD